MQVTYRIACAAGDIERRATAIAIEQSIEMPLAGVRQQRVRDAVVGQVLDLRADGPDHYLAIVGLALETTGFEAGQLMNMLFGNSSLHPDVTLLDVSLPDAALAAFGGPRFGLAGLRGRLGRPHGPLTCSALKPQGSDVATLAALAGTLARAGIDLIKDDHGLADQASAPFAERITAVQRAIDEANAATGGHTCYAPSLTGGPSALLRQRDTALAAGIQALMIAPMVAGTGALQELAETGLPLLAHPALAGNCRIEPVLLLGKLFRLLGADAVIYPNHGGRFSFGEARCHALADALRRPWHTLQAACPVPAGGIQLSRIAELRAFYGDDVMLLIGGAVLEAPDVGMAARHFVEQVHAQEDHDHDA